MPKRTADEKLYDKSVDATNRYFADWPKGKTELGRLLDKTQREFYRAGWMIGYRAGKRASQRRGESR